MRHTDFVQLVVFSPDGLRLASAPANHTICLWDALSGTPIGEQLHKHTDCVSSIAFLPSGQQLASGLFDCTVRLWNAISGRGHVGLVHFGSVSHNDSQFRSINYDREVHLWDTSSGTSQSHHKATTLSGYLLLDSISPQTAG